MRTLQFSLLLLILLSQAAVAPQLQAQDQEDVNPSYDAVAGVSLILEPFGPGNGVTAYVATEMGADVSAYYDAEVDAYLYYYFTGGSTLLNAPGNYFTGNPAAENTVSGWAGTGTYEVQSNHYLILFDIDEDGYYDDPCDFSDAGSGYGLDTMSVSGDCEDEDTSPVEYGGSSIYVGSTYYSVDATPPTIQSTSPSLTLDSSGTLTISGVGLTNWGADPSPQVCMASGAGLTFTGAPNPISDNELQVTYSVDGNGSSAGPHSIEVTTIAGSSAPFNVQVGDPTPVITSITTSQADNALQAGSPTSLTVNGKYFGTNPIITIAGVSCGSGTSAAIDYCAITSSNDDGTWSWVSATVTADVSAGGTQLAVTVTSQGYNANGFVSVPGNSNTTPAAYVQVDPAPVPVLQIMFNGTNIANNGTPSCPGSGGCVVAGQQIALTAKITVGGNPITPDSQKWTQPPGNAIANFVPSNQSGTVILLPNPKGTATDCQSNLTQNCLNFYWVDQGNGRPSRTRPPSEASPARQLR
jgi:hypothetical protein